jgi:actin-related protein
VNTLPSKTQFEASLESDPLNAHASLMASLYGNILYCGSRTKVATFRERLQFEVETLVKNDFDAIDPAFLKRGGVSASYSQLISKMTNQLTPTTVNVFPLLDAVTQKPIPHPHLRGGVMLARQQLQGDVRVFQSKAEYEEIGRYVIT